MSRKSIKKIEKFYSDETVTGVEKDNETGFYRMIIQKFTREHDSGNIKKADIEKSDMLYEMCEKNEAEKTYIVNDIGGAEMAIHFKACKSTRSK